MPESEDANFRKKMLETASSVAYRYCPREAAEALESTREMHPEFVAYYGGDLVSFPDGLTLAAREQKRMESEWAAADPKEAARAMEELGLKHPRPRMTFPPEFLNHDREIGGFFDPETGLEYMREFDHVISGLRRKGKGLTEDELQAVRAIITDKIISPAFVRRLAAEHGAESIAEVFLLRDCPAEVALEFLLRRHKGHYFKKVYPSIVIRSSSSTDSQTT